ncbi:ferredoxin-type protein NapF [Litchfieldella xinjiangensis]|uniref:ferredoxin-type protein NapF n=1 Tax=Litchfieldella xinjiangensis TaxID=1166948 RepID=UPI0005BC5525|nr:ferredoxin-type protein NapF [Halomonas xinjiangensis]
MAVDASRRALLQGRPGRPLPLRPPWAEAEPRFTSRCTRCTACMEACETGIIVRGDGGFPEVDFQRGECTFCQACVDVCEASAFHDPEHSSPWSYVAKLGDRCLGRDGVYCRSCGESCEVGAIRFFFNAHRVPEPELDTTLCTGCGACVAGCPTQTLSVGRP